MMQIVKYNEDSIKITFPYNHEFIARIKTIKGRKWHPDDKCWTVPNNNETINQILKIFEKENLQIDPDLKFAQINYDFLDLKKELVSRKYSYKTLKSYVYYNRELIAFTGKNPSEITNEDIKIF